MTFSVSSYEQNAYSFNLKSPKNRKVRACERSFSTLIFRRQSEKWIFDDEYFAKSKLAAQNIVICRKKWVFFTILPSLSEIYH